MFFQKLKRIHIQCILGLLLVNRSLQTQTALLSCPQAATNAAKTDSEVACEDSTGTSAVYCITATTNGSLYKSDHTTDANKCEAETSKTGDILFQNDGAAILGFSSGSSGFLYHCTGAGTGCTQIKSDGYYLATEGENKYLMNCVSTSGICTKVASPANGYYKPSADDTTNKLYSCSDTCVGKTSLAVGFYLSGASFESSVYKKLIQCTSSTVCNEYSGTIVINKFYGNGDGATTSGTTVTYASLITCSAANSCTETTVGAAGVYLDALTSANVFTCTYASNKASCTTGTGDTGNGKGYIDAGTTTANESIITCTSTAGCVSYQYGNAVADIESVAQKTGFLDAANNGQLIICTTGSTCTTGAVTGAQGLAILDGKNYTTTDKFSNLIKWKSGTTWEYVSVPSQTEAYIDAGSVSNSNYANVITYDATNKFVVKAGSKQGDGIAYIDATDKKKIIKCDDNTCTSGANGATNTAPTYFIDGIDNINIIKCAGANNDCSSSAGSASTDEFVKYYLDSINEGVIKCDKGAACEKEGSPKSTDGNGYVDAGSEDLNVITCNTNSKCASVPYGNAQAAPEGGVAINTGFIDAGNDGNLIICSTSGCVTSTITGADGQAILDGKSYTAAAGFTKLIIKDSTWTYSATSVAAGEAYIDVGSPSGTNYPNIITFADSKFSVSVGNSTIGYAYIEAKTKSNVIKCTETTCTSTPSGGDDSTKTINFIDGTNPKNIITCKATCSTDSPDASEELTKYYIDGTKTTNVITCENAKDCVSDVGSIGQGIAYIDGNDQAKLFSCVANTGCAALATVSSTEGEVYIDGSDSTNKYKKIITCESGSDCVSSNQTTLLDNGDLFFIDATDNTKIIKCTKTDGCSSDTGSKEEGEAYIDGTDNTKIIICSDSSCASSVGNDGTTKKADTYVSADDNTKIISCLDGDGNNECITVSTNARNNNSEYYARLEAGTTEIIKCHVTDKCKLDKTTAPQPNAVFINGLFKETATDKGDHDNTLIVCKSDKSCAPYKPVFESAQSPSRKRESTTKQVVEQSTPPSPKFFVNGDADSTQKVIKCAAENQKCSSVNGADKSVYINSNPETSSTKQLIKCKEGGVCEEKEAGSSDSEKKYYLNAGTSSKNDAVIECAATCGVLEAKLGKTYINDNDISQLIICTDSGCSLKTSGASPEKKELYLNSSDVDVEGNTKHEKDLIICSKEDDTTKCEAYDGVDNGVYLNSANKTTIIICKKDQLCKVEINDATDESPKYYVNGDPTNKSDEKLKYDLIKCKKSGCDVVNGNNGDTYLNANIDDKENPLIICTTEDGCVVNGSEATDATAPPVYYVNSGSALVDKRLNDTLIKCTKEESGVQCDIKNDAAVNQVYVNYGSNKSEYQLIKCSTGGCKQSQSNPSENNNEFYVNAGDTDETSLKNDLIECVIEKEEGKETVSKICKEMAEPKVGVYLNSNFSGNGDKNQLIKCTNEDGCKGIASASDSKNTEYYVNAEATDLTNAIIFCSNKKCEKQTAALNTYYVGVGEDIEVNGLIECVKEESQPVKDEQPKKRDTTTTSEEKCKLSLSNSYQGYYLNAGSNKAVNQVIVCDSTEGCKSEKVDLGYYVNAGDSTKPIIKCEKEGSECTAGEAPSCPEPKDANAGNFCYDDEQLKFFTASNSTAVSATKSDDYYTFAEIPSGGFPGIKSATGSLFKISRYFITRFYKGGVIMIDKNGRLVDNLSGSDQSDISLYECNDSTKLCSEKPGCTSNTYMFDSENNKAVFCNNGKLEYADFTGYVVDGNRIIGSNHPYIIECQNNGSKCTTKRPKSSSYFENSGYDSNTNSLIECSNNNCYTVAAEVGYYVGHEGEGIIQCSSSSSCSFSPMKGKSVKYVNAGSNKASNAIIECTKKNKCTAGKAKIGYYMTYSSSILIQCTSPSNCVEFTPTVNYYDNADSSESSNSIINCVQSSQVITCALEATNNGFYMSSSPNVLIRCKSGNKCKTVVVKNGIFRGALKGLTGGSKRSAEDTELEEDGKSVAMPRDSDEAYGIIRCVAGKCSALSPSEVASIPVCEFNNNKCYITLDYAMTKSATTSISAGNICTNPDRSVFYFATDTIVVKPNVISGITATYVYTTTNSNCLEVNDSYNDMYFTVGSTIYLLDQGSVLQFYEQGYYFINTAKNTLVGGNEIEDYNDESVKLYRCNGNSCNIMDKPNSTTYYADVNKRIIKYNVNSDSYTFAYDKDIICIYNNSKCTPNADIKNREFCITYKGELALAKQDIKNRETGECYKAASITNNIYGYSQYLYNMNTFSAEMVDETGYYIVSLSTNTTVVSKNYKTKNSNLVVYGCQLSSCKEFIPDENVYYYDARAKNILRYRDGVWSSPSSSGYAYISIDPATTYIYRFTKNGDEVKINAMANYGYYYTVDGEMYHCDRDEDGECSPIENTGYYFTNAGEVYYCVHDSEGIEPTECTKQACVSGQYYYIDEAYYRCESSSTLVPVMSRYCSYNDNVVINFPLALTEEFPDKIKQAVEGIEKNNNSTAIVSRRGKNYLESVSGIFTNCTYNVEETKSTFDLVCVNNYVTVDEETDDVKICSMEQLGFVECIEDEENPEKCNVSAAFPMVRPALFTIVLMALSLLLLNQF